MQECGSLCAAPGKSRWCGHLQALLWSVSSSCPPGAEVQAVVTVARLSLIKFALNISVDQAHPSPDDIAFSFQVKI